MVLGMKSARISFIHECATDGSYQSADRALEMIAEIRSLRRRLARALKALRRHSDEVTIQGVKMRFSCGREEIKAERTELRARRGR